MKTGAQRAARFCFPPRLLKLSDGALESALGGFIDVQAELKFMKGVGIEDEETGVSCSFFIVGAAQTSGPEAAWRRPFGGFVVASSREEVSLNPRAQFRDYSGLSCRWRSWNSGDVELKGCLMDTVLQF